MPGRRASDPGDSLELLLDTICNAFGGILYLTILLTMLLRLSHPKTDSQAATESARHEMIELSRQLEMVLTELETLEKSLAVRQRQISIPADTVPPRMSASGVPVGRTSEATVRPRPSPVALARISALYCESDLLKRMFENWQTCMFRSPMSPG